MTKAREWPNKARCHRDYAYMESIRALRALEPLLEKPRTELETIRRISIGINALNKIALELVEAGAPAR